MKENIGNGLKTLYARFADIQMGETLEDGVDLGQVTTMLDKVGVEVLNAEGKMNNVGDIMEELMDVWKTLDSTQKNAIATTLAGKYQLSRFEALMNRSDLYEDYKEASENAEGTLDVMNEKYINSLRGKLNQLQSSFEGIVLDVMNSDDFKGIIDGLTTILDLFQDLIESIGGGGQALSAFGAVAVKVFGKNIASGIGNMVSNRQMANLKRDNQEYNNAMLSELGLSSNIDKMDKRSQDLLNFANRTNQYDEVMSQEQLQARNELLQKSVDTTNKLVAAESELQQKVEATNIAYRAQGLVEPGEDIIKQRNGQYDFGELAKEQLEFGPDFSLSQAWLQQDQNLINAKDDITDITQALSQFKDAYREAGQAGTQSIENINKVMQKLDKGMTGLSSAQGILGKHYEKMLSLQMQLSTAMDSAETEQEAKEIEQLADAYNKAAVEMTKLIEAIQNGNVIKTADQGMAEQSAVNDEATKLGVYNKQQEGMLKGFDVQDKIQEFVDVTASVGQLAFAWESFQSLGSIWVNTDLSGGEKLQQTILNLSMTIPMVVSALQSLGKATGAQMISEKILTKSKEKSIRMSVLSAQASTAEAQARRAESMGNTVAAQRYRDLAAAKREAAIAGASASTAAKGLSAVMNAMGGPVGIAVTVLSVLSTVIGGVQQHYEDLKRAEYECAEFANQEANSAIEVTKNWEVLNETYQLTGKASEEFKTQSVQVAEQLGIEGAAALAASEQWMALSDAIQSVREQKIQESIKASEAILNGQNRESIEGKEWFNGSSYADLLTKKANVIVSVNNDEDAKYIRDLFSDFDESIENDFIGQVKAAETSLNNFKKAQEELNAVPEPDRNVEWEQRSKLIQEAISQMTIWLEQEDVAQQKEAMQTVAEQGTQTQDFQEAVSEAKTYEELYDIFSQDKNVGDWFTNLGTEAEKAAFVLSHVNNELAQDLALVKQMEEGFTSQEYLDERPDFLIGSNLDEGQTLEDWQKEIVERINNLNLSNDDKITLYGELDEAVTAGEVNQAIEHLENDGSIDSINISGKLQHQQFDGVGDYDSEKQEKILETANIDENTFLEYKNSLLSKQSDLYKAIEDNSRRAAVIEEKMASLDPHDDEYKKLAAELEGVNEAGKSLDTTLNDLTLRVIETQNGLNQLATVTDEQFEAFRKGETLSQDYIKGLDSIRSSMAQVLNVDEEAVSTRFIEDNLESIYALATGDLTQIDALRAAMSKEAVMNLDIQWSDYNTSKEGFMDMLAEFQAEIPNLEIGTSLDDTPFVKTLNKMLEDGDISAKDISAILSNINMDYSIDYKTMDVPQIIYETKSQIRKNIANADSIGDMVSATAEGIQTMSQVESEIEYGKAAVPYITGTSSGGGGGGSGRTPTRFSSPKRSSSGKKSGGSKGGKGSSYKPKSKDPIKEQIDRYEKVNTQLEDVENTISRINKEQDRLKGFDQGDNINRQTNLLEKQLKITKEKYRIQKKEAKELRSKLAKDFGIKFDGEGFIKNYASTLKKLEGNVNNLINQYNKATTEKAQEKLEKKIERAQKKLDNFKELYQRYDTLWGTELRESEEAVEDLKDAIEDLRIEAFKTATEVVDNIKDMNDAMIDFERSIKNIKSLRDDNPFDDLADGVKKIGFYFDDATSKADTFYGQAKKKAQGRAKEADKELAAAKKKLKSAKTPEDKRVAKEAIKKAKLKKANANSTVNFYNQMEKDAETGKTGTGYFDMVTHNREMILDQIKQYESTGTSSIFGKNSEALYETAKEILEQSEEAVNDFASDLLEMKEALLNAIDEIANRVSEMNDSFENITNDLDYYYDMIEKINGDQAYDDLTRVLDSRIANRQAQINMQQQAIEAYKIEMRGMEVGSDAYKKVQEDMREAQETIHELTLSNIEDAQKKASLAVDKVTNKWANSLMNMKRPNSNLDNNLTYTDENGVTQTLAKDLDWMATEWELINRNADYYLDDVNASYQTQKLQHKYLDLLNESQGTSLGIQNKITAQMNQQLDYLRNKKNLSEYDIAYAEAQLEILQKQIALEEAQQNKKQMRLRRDSQGNYRYQYVADKSDTGDAEADLAEAQNNAYNLSKEQMKQTQADSLAALQQAKQSIADIWNNANLTLEEQKARTQYILDNMKEYIAGTSEQLQESEKNIINDFIGMTELLADENRGRLESIYEQIIAGNIDAFDQIDTRWSTSLTDWLYNVDDFIASTDNMYAELAASGEEYQSQVEAITGQVGENYDNIKDHIDACTDATKKLSEANKDFIDQLKEDAGTVASYNQQLSAYQKQVSDITNEMGKYQQQVKELQNKLKEKEAENAALTAQASPSKGGKPSGSGSKDGKSSGGDKGKGYAGTKYDQATLIEGIAGNIWTYDSWSDGDTRISRIKQRFGSAGKKIYKLVQDKFNDPHKAYGYDYDPPHWEKEGMSYYKKFDYSKFDTGGYTGTWSDNTGHDKNGKLALLHQKELVLNASDTENMLKIVQAVRALTTNLKTNMLNSADSFGRISAIQTSPQEIEQKVQIDATFPNVRDASEIEEALLGLTNEASQYALRIR